MMEADVQSAFDEMTPSLMAEAMKAAAIPSLLIAAVLREHRPATASASYCEVETGPFVFDK